MSPVSILRAAIAVPGPAISCRIFPKFITAEFHEQIQVNSAVRTVKVQKKLRRHNRNAAPADGDTASSHLAGITVDLQRRGMTKEQIRFVERYLFYLNALGLVEPEEERRHWCFHIMVSDRYTDWRQTQTIFPHSANGRTSPHRPLLAPATRRLPATEAPANLNFILNSASATISTE